MLTTHRWRARDIGSVDAVAKLLFVAYKKKVSLRVRSAVTARVQLLAEAPRSWCCGPKKRLPVLTTHRWRARDIGSLDSVARLLFLREKKEFHCAYAAQSCIAMRGTRWRLLTGSICTLRVTPTARFEGRAISNVTMALLLFILVEINERHVKELKELRRALSFCPMLCA